MKDDFGRTIDYMRISVTDRCNLRCRYCMPHDLPGIPHEEILRYEELLRICRIAVKLGIDRFKITGGEPLVRKGVTGFIRALKRMEGVRCVTVTTNGVLLKKELPALIEAGTDGINISLDAVSRDCFCKITGRDEAQAVLEAIRCCAQSGIRTKINTVMAQTNDDQLMSVAALAEKLPVDVRFIELMPIGYGAGMRGPGFNEMLERLKSKYTDLHLVDEKRGNGPAVYYGSGALTGRIGMIGTNSHQFCNTCNRVRLTSTGQLKLCLCYVDGANLRALLRGGADDDYILHTIQNEILKKPAAHCFTNSKDMTEHRQMNQIGG